jgi:hypothetical protein
MGGYRSPVSRGFELDPRRCGYIHALSRVTSEGRMVMKKLKAVKVKTARSRKSSRPGERRTEVHKVAESVRESVKADEPQGPVAAIVMPFLRFPFALMMAIGDTIQNMLPSSEPAQATTH